MLVRRCEIPSSPLYDREKEERVAAIEALECGVLAQIRKAAKKILRKIIEEWK